MTVVLAPSTRAMSNKKDRYTRQIFSEDHLPRKFHQNRRVYMFDGIPSSVVNAAECGASDVKQEKGTRRKKTRNFLGKARLGVHPIEPRDPRRSRIPRKLVWIRGKIGGSNLSEVNYRQGSWRGSTRVPRIPDTFKIQTPSTYTHTHTYINTRTYFELEARTKLYLPLWNRKGVVSEKLSEEPCNIWSDMRPLCGLHGCSKVEWWKSFCEGFETLNF